MFLILIRIRKMVNQDLKKVNQDLRRILNQDLRRI
jgi:hypothetical protein